MSLNTRFNAPFTSGASSSTLVPDPYPCAVNGRPFMIDTNQTPDQHQHASIPYLTKYLTSPVFGSPTSVAEVGESSLNPDISWRRSSAAWHHGAGQNHFDLAESDRLRFRSSKGIDVWTIGQFGLLPDTTNKRSSANTNLHGLTAGTYAYVVDGSALKYTTDFVTYSDAGIATSISSADSDGHTVWSATGSGVYQTTRGTGSSTVYNDLVCSLITYTKGRLMAAQGPSIYNIVSGHIAVPTGLTVAPVGTTGSTTYAYRVSANNSAGQTLACAQVVITNGNATLSATNFNQLNWTAVVGATSYTVYGRTSGAELELETSSTNSYQDTLHIVTPAGALPTSDTSGAAPTALFTQANSDWQWVGFATGDSCIYAAGYSGDYSAIYRIPIKSDGTGLDAPVQAGELPTGETALSIVGYLSFVYIGTTVGIRLATQASSGELQIGSAIPCGPVRCAVGFGRFVYFGWENYDTTSTGLGRLDVTVINTDAPAYATDLMATAQGHVTSVFVLNSTVAFTVAGTGLFLQSVDLVASGQIDSGLITYDLPDPKVAQSIDVRHQEPLNGTHAVALAADEGAFSLLGIHDGTTAETPFSCRTTTGEVFEVRHILTPSLTAPTMGPFIQRATLMSIPAALSGEQITVPLLIRTYDSTDSGSEFVRSIPDDLSFLKNLRKTKQSFSYQEGGVSYRATMQDYTFMTGQLTTDRSAYEGTFFAQLLVQSLDIN